MIKDTFPKNLTSPLTGATLVDPYQLIWIEIKDGKPIFNKSPRTYEEKEIIAYLQGNGCQIEEKEKGKYECISSGDIIDPASKLTIPKGATIILSYDAAAKDAIDKLKQKTPQTERQLPTFFRETHLAPNATTDYSFSIMILGDTGVGREALVDRYVDDTYTETYCPGFSPDFKLKTIDFNGKTIKLQIWPGNPYQHRTVDNPYFMRPHGIIFMFDLTDKQSYENITKIWIPELKHYERANDAILIGNNSDLPSKRRVFFQDAEGLAKTHNMKYIEVSARRASNVDEAFAILVEQLLLRHGLRPKETTPAAAPSASQKSCVLM